MSHSPGLLTLQQKVLLEHLRHCRGSPLPIERFVAALYGDRIDGGPEHATKVVIVQLARLRSYLAESGVHLLTIGRTRATQGYMIDPRHLDLLEEVLAEMPQAEVICARLLIVS